MPLARRTKDTTKATAAPTSVKRGSAAGRVVDPAADPTAIPFIAAFIDDRGQVVIARVADSFGMSKSQLAETVGLGREAFYKATRAGAVKTQSRVREMLEIVSRVAAWAGGTQQAMAWYRAQPIPAFGGRTAEALVKSGAAGAVRDYLDHLALGGFA